MIELFENSTSLAQENEDLKRENRLYEAEIRQLRESYTPTEKVDLPENQQIIDKLQKEVTDLTSQLEQTRQSNDRMADQAIVLTEKEKQFPENLAEGIDIKEYIIYKTFVPMIQQVIKDNKFTIQVRLYQGHLAAYKEFMEE